MPRTGPLLPHEPRIANPVAEQALTERFLAPALDDLDALFRWLRADAEPALVVARPAKMGKAFPIGQCLEISRAVEARLRTIEAASLDGAPARGLIALTTFMRHGGTMRKVWGDLRGEYFQNAFIAGSLYVDVANDTVVATKPAVEILPFDQSRLFAIEDYRHYAAVAGRYWGARLYPNHVLPSLAPYFPLVSVRPNGAVRLEAMSVYMVQLTRSDAFRPSEDVLGDDAMDPTLFALMAGVLADPSPDRLPADPGIGRDQALGACRDHRRNGWEALESRRETMVAAALEANRRLEPLRVD